jgi:hypothetical protein
LAKGAPLADDIATAVRRLVAAKRGRELAQCAGISSQALERGASGGAVLRSTAHCIRVALVRLGEIPPSEAAS